MELLIRCYKANLNGISTKVNKGEFWTRKFIQLDGNKKVQTFQSASCPNNRFVDEIVFDENGKFIAIRCRYVQAQLNGKNYRGSWSSDFWSRQFTSADASQINSAQCPNSSVIAEVIQKSGGLYIRCRQVMVNGSPLNFTGDYWTRFFATRN